MIGRKQTNKRSHWRCPVETSSSYITWPTTKGSICNRKFCCRSPTHTVWKDRETEGFKGAYGYASLSAQFHIVCRKQNHADIYGPRGCPLAVRKPDALGHSSLQPSAITVISHTRAHTQVRIMNDPENTGAQWPSADNISGCCDCLLLSLWLSARAHTRNMTAFQTKQQCDCQQPWTAQGL